MGWRVIYDSMKKDWYNIPNLITTARLILSLVFPVLLVAYSDNIAVWWWSFGIFVALALTDKLDGYIAKNYNMVTDWGKVLDPLADKVLVVPVLVVLCWLHASWILWIVVGLIVAREVHVTLILKRGAYADGQIESARESGRIKMVAHVVMVAALLIPTMPEVYSASIVVLTAAITLWSWWDYIVAAKPRIAPAS